MRSVLLAGVAIGFATAAAAEECSPKPWNLVGEEPACFSATVVDLLCEIAGDCPENCGNGTRQMGLVRKSDGVLIYPNKNVQPVFSGAATDLAPYCGKTVDVVGLLIGGDEILEGVAKVYMVQEIREADGEWKKTNQFTKIWGKTHPDAKGKGPWFRRDPRVKAEIEADGYLGLGHDADEAFIKDWY